VLFPTVPGPDNGAVPDPPSRKDPMFSLVVPLLTLAPVAGPFPVPAPVPACAPLQEEDPVVDERDEVKQLLEELDQHVKEKGREDEEAIGAIDRLLQEFGQSGPKDRASIVKELDGCFKAKRTKELEDGVPDDRLFYAAATALGSMGPESVKPLIKLLGHKSHRKNLRLQRRIALSLGQTESEEAVKPLMDLLKDDQPAVQAAGADALGSFRGLDLKIRKEIFEELLKTMMGVKSKVDTDPTDMIADERWRTISGPIVATLQRLSGHDETDPQMWQRWWNNNKKKDWDAEGE